MTCCGCTLAGWTVTAVVLGLLESILGLSWNILVIVVMSQENPVSSNTTENTMKPLPADDFANATDTSSNDTDYFMSVTRNVDYNSLWENLTLNLKTDPDVQEYRAFELVITALVLNGLWLITTLGLAVGNAEKCRDMLKPWIGATVIITVTDIAATVYFIFGAIKRDEEFDIQTSFFTNVDVFFAVLFSRGFIIIWIINIALCVFVAQRVKEIEVSKSKRMPFDSDFRIMSYPPYDAYETQSSTRTAKNFRPHTPPPDYEANGKKRRPSFSSQTETMTLPISMASSRTSRPLSQSSYIYDDRVELQHRASCAAETVLHAYDNKGLVMETDGWMGIPRPSLKSNHH